MLKNIKDRFDLNAKLIKDAHWDQSPAQIAKLNEKYKAPAFGNVSPWSLIEKLGMCVDPTDRELYGASQWLHTMQVMEAMEKDNVHDEEFLLAGILHDLGKVLLLTTEAPENVVCDNSVVGKHTNGVGLDNCLLHWNHDEYAYMKLKTHVPYHVAWIIRYHSIKVDVTMPYLDQKDMALYSKYLVNFRKYDKLTKSIYRLPQVDTDKYRRLVEKHLPATMEF